MVSRCINALAMFMIVGGLTLPMTVQAQQGGGVSHWKFARDLALRLGLVQPNTATPEDVFGLLIAAGVVPKGGWEANKVLTVGDFARVVVQVLERASGETLVPAGDRDDDNAFIEAAKGADYNLESIEQTLSGMKTLPDKTGPAANREATTTDPKSARRVFGQPDERASGADFTGNNTFPSDNILDPLPEASAPVAPSTVAQVIRSLPVTPAPTSPSNPS